MFINRFLKKHMNLSFLFSFVLGITSPIHAKPASPNTPPSVLVSIKPIHSLVAGIMEGVGDPDLLITSDASPHHVQLKPSEEQKLYGAQIIIWVGESYEGGLKKRLDNLQSGNTEIITLMDLEGIHLYPYRQFKQQGPCPDTPIPCCDHPHGDCNAGHHHEISGKDGHIWLAPNNATVIVTKIAQKLAAHDLKHAAHYLANSKKVIARIQALATDLQQELKSVKGVPYFTFHDFTQYFDRYFGTTCKGVIRVNPNVEPSPKHMQEIQDQVMQKEANVLFAEPQFDSKLIAALVKDTGIYPAQLDYLGYQLDPGPDLYFEMMRRLAHDLSTALAESQSIGLSIVKDIKDRFS